jgi:hypothetical protein
LRLRAISLVLLLALVAFPAADLSAADIPLVNWSAPPTYQPAGGISAMAAMPFQPVTPCRVYDSRTTAPAGLLTGGSSRTIAMDTVCGLPPGAAAYSIHITAFGSAPSTSYGFITAYPTGASLPTVSTMNFLGGTQTSSAAVVPSGSGWDINVFTTTTTHFVIDVNGYYSNEMGTSNFFAVHGAYSGGGVAYAVNTAAGANSAAFRGYVSGNGSVFGVWGEAAAGASSGVRGTNSSINPDSSGVSGQSTGGAGVRGYGTGGSGYGGVFTSANFRGLLVTGTASWYDALFNGDLGIRVDKNVSVGGNVSVVGTVSKGGGSFKIDHPLDPENKYLYHSFVESPDMMNIYNGNVVLAADGRAVVQMPEWFDALNSEFRYQLTAIGAPAPELHVAQPIDGNQFVIAGGKAGMEVSWQVTGVRKDAWARKNRIPVEEVKSVRERGFYLHPEAFDLPDDRGVERERARLRGLGLVTDSPEPGEDAAPRSRSNR